MPHASSSNTSNNIRSSGSRPSRRRASPRAGEAGALTLRATQVCDAVGAFIEYWGFKGVYGRIWAYLAIRHEPLSQIEIARGLGISRSLVSTSLAELVEYGLVKPTGTHRNAPYEAVMDVWPTVSDVLRSREWHLLESARSALTAMREEIDVAQAHDPWVPYSTERITFLLSMTEIAQSFLKLLIAIRVPKALEHIRGWTDRAAALIQGLLRAA